MKILITVESLDSGGTERQILELCKGLSRRNNISIAIASMKPGGVYDVEISKYAKLFHFADKIDSWRISNFLRLKNIIKTFNPDIIQVTSTMNLIYALPLAWLYKKKYVNGIIRDNIKKITWQQLVKRMSIYFSKYIVSNSIMGLKTYHVPITKKTFVVYNGIDIERFENIRGTIDLNLDSNYIHVGVVANITYHKDYHTIIGAATLLKNKGNKIRFHIFGDGPLRTQIQNKISSLHLNEMFIFYGSRKDVDLYLHNFHFGLLSSYEKIGEGISNSILEFMANGKPVIASNVGATPEIIEDGVNGLLFKASNQYDLFHKLVYAINNISIIDKLGTEARKTVVTKFSYAKMIDTYEQLYHSIITN